MRQKRNTTGSYRYEKYRDSGNPRLPRSNRVNAATRAGKPARTPTFLAIPQNRVVCGIDPGETPGWSIYIQGVYIDSGIAKLAIEKQQTVQRSYEIARFGETSLLFIAENWPKPFLPNRKRMSHESILGMGQNWGLWLQEIKKLYRRHQNIFRINTYDWRKNYNLQRYSKDQAKQMAMPIASQLSGRKIEDHNEAEAILIANVGCYLEV